MPPRHGKTLFAGAYFPFYYLGVFQDRDIIYASATKTLAEEQGEYVRQLVEEFGPSLFGITVSGSSSAKDNWDIVNLQGRSTGGSMRCFGVDSAVHGRNADLLILDDLVGSIRDAISPAHRDAVHRVYTSSLYTRLSPRGAVVSIGTPTHSDDWFGRMLKAEGDGGDKWERLKMPAMCSVCDGSDSLGRAYGEALWPQRWSKEALEAIKANLTANNNLRDWRAQYELEPVSGDGVSEWPSIYFDRIYDQYYMQDSWCSALAIDVSKGQRAQKKGDYQAFAHVRVDRKGHCYVDVHLYRLDVAGLRAKAIELYNLYQPTAVIIETNNAGYTLWESLVDMQTDGLYWPVLGRNHGGQENKILRITQRLGRALESGILHFVKSPHNQMAVDQMRFFPHGDYDDAPDAVEMALEFISQYRLPKHQRKVNYQTRLTPVVKS